MHWRTLVVDFRFWILLFFAVRLLGITNPPAEVTHNWRQASTNMVARNFYEVDANILHPRIDNAGALTGITGMEFPLLNYCIYLVSLPFGFEHWYGRLINLLISSLGCWFFYRLVRDRFGDRVALAAGIVLLASNWLMYSRKVMPDTFSTALVIMGIWMAYRYLKLGGAGRLIGFALLTCAGLLSKIPSGILLPVLVIPVFDSSISKQRKAVLIAVGALALLPVLWWYGYWSPHLIETYGNEHFFVGTSLAEGGQELLAHLGETAKRFYYDAMKFSGFLAALAGLFLLIKRKEKAGLAIAGLTTIALVAFMLKSGRAFYHHGYYIVSFVPVMALLAGYALAQVKQQAVFALLIGIVMVEGITSQQHDFRLKPKHDYWLELETWADSVSKRDDLVIMSGGKNPSTLYFAHRKGWTVSDDVILNSEAIQGLAEHGARYLFLDKVKWPETAPKLPYNEVFSNEQLSIYEL